MNTTSIVSTLKINYTKDKQKRSVSYNNKSSSLLRRIQRGWKVATSFYIYVIKKWTLYKINFLLLILGLSLSAFFPHVKAQETDYARMVVNTLSSDEFMGRGYVENGDKLAADFIRDEFKKHGLKPFSKNYTQSFHTPVNTFPNTITFKVNSFSLEAGRDYIADAGSPTLKGIFDVILVSPEDLLADETLIPKLQQAPGKFLAIEPFAKDDFSKEKLDRINGVIGFLKYHENSPAEGIMVLSREKLTWSGSATEYSRPSFTVLADSIPEKIENVEINLKNKFHKRYKTQNLIGYVEGERSDSSIVFIAHYDHLGVLGKEAIFTGANDNASGTAMLLSLAKYYAENKPKYNTIFIAFGAEELGLVGSRYFIENPLFDLSAIKFLINFDISGTGDDGIQVVNGSVYRDKYDLLTQLNEEHQLLPEVKIRGNACNSDHCMFDRQNVPNFYIYTLGGIQAYHDIYDRPETLPLTEFEDFFTLITKFVDQL